jgi:predicted O-linked N-acetylglucosamine transferase (SPINDLY family)
MGYNFVGFFENLDRSKFEVIAVSFIEVSDSPLSQRLVAAFDEFKIVDKMTDTEVCQWMREKHIDIAVDMMGPTLNNRQGIFAMRCAPVQVNQFSWTSGAPYMDYIIADPVSMPQEYAAGYSEKLAYVPHTLFATDDKREVAQTTPLRSHENLPEQGMVFCCFNNSLKITPEVFSVWMGILQKVPDSVLWIRSAGASMEKNLCQEAQSRGVDPARLIFARRVESMPEHLARYRLADLFLDTFPFCAQTTASDALWAGVPVVTCVGESSMSRICASLLHALDMPELVTGSLQEYERKVLELANDRNKLEETKQKLKVQRQTAPLFNTALYTRNIEQAYQYMV